MTQFKKHVSKFTGKTSLYLADDPGMGRFLAAEDQKQLNMAQVAPFKPGDRVKLNETAWEVAKPASKADAEAMLGICTVEVCHYMGNNIDGDLWCVDLVELPLYMFQAKHMDKI